ncbi:hypothetical protein SISNIDRAFT_487108 [Sistotremastrum niveocremeum HHB9708]|uniref:F-box domain-containing protein n=1 Tax=Sistotremastrum niveocremeum HHB9708 TaxID=1314777 RepID=A0A164STM2_9AGAM|nr:hypothetical protein SISNIDRAFT_487108 [Sistotremastrum niveocremeum HHB9708]
MATQIYVNGIPSALQLSELLAAFENSIAEGVQIIQKQALHTRQDDAKLEQVDQAFSQLNQRISSLPIRLKQQRNLCTPLGRLSDEIILQILGYCLVSNAGDNSLQDLYYIEETIPLSSAFFFCKRWRDLANSYPPLWSQIALPCNPNLFRLFRDRSGTSLMRVHLTNVGVRSDDVHMHALGDSLCQLAPQISELQVDWMRDVQNLLGWDQFLARHLRQNELSSLKSLLLTDGGSHQLTDYIISTPVLQTLRVYAKHPLAPLHMRVDNLVELSYLCDSLSPLNILRLLSEFPRIERCSIYDQEPESHSRSETLPVISLPRLKSIHIGSLYLSDMRQVLGNLEVPSSAHLRLETIELHSRSTSIEGFLAPYLASTQDLNIVKSKSLVTYRLTLDSGRLLVVENKFEHGGGITVASLAALSRYPTNLSRVNLKVQHLPSLYGIVEILSSWPSVKHIGVCTQYADFERLLTALMETPNTTCPLLRSFDCTGTKFSGNYMKRFLEFRTSKSVALQELNITEGFSDLEPGEVAHLVGKVREIPVESKLRWEVARPDCDPYPRWL